MTTACQKVPEGVCSLTGVSGQVERVLVRNQDGVIKITRINHEIAKRENLIGKTISIEEYQDFLEDYNYEKWSEDE